MCSSDLTDNREYFKFVSDSSISRTQGQEGEPIECVSPVLDNNDGFGKLKKCCESLNAAGAYVNRSTGLHVHIGAQNLNGEQYVNVFKNYQKLENVIDSFMAPSRRNSRWAKSLWRFDFSDCYSPEGVELRMHDRYFKVNPESYSRHNTIEFRQHQGSTDFTKIKNWVNFCAKLVQWSMSNVFESEVTSIDEIPFLTKTEKNFFKRRQSEFASRAAA